MKVSLIKFPSPFGLVCLAAFSVSATATAAPPAADVPAASDVDRTSAASSPPASEERSAPRAEPNVTRGTVALVAAGIAVVGAGVGTVFGVLALENKAAYRKHPTYANSDDGDADAAYADGAMALALAAGVTSLVLYLTRDTVPDEDPPPVIPKPRPTISASPLVTRHEVGGGVLVRF